MNKLYPDAETALRDIVKDGQTIAVFWFMRYPGSIDRRFT